MVELSREEVEDLTCPNCGEGNPTAVAEIVMLKRKVQEKLALAEIGEKAVEMIHLRAIRNEEADRDLRQRIDNELKGAQERLSHLIAAHLAQKERDDNG